MAKALDCDLCLIVVNCKASRIILSGNNYENFKNVRYSSFLDKSKIDLELLTRDILRHVYSLLLCHCEVRLILNTSTPVRINIL